MKKIIVGIVILIVVIIGAYFLFFNKSDEPIVEPPIEINNLDDLAVNVVKDYVQKNNIVVNDNLFVKLKTMNDKNFDHCNMGSGVLVINHHNELEYYPYLSCDNYHTPINNNSYLIGREIMILNDGEKYIELGLNTEYQYVTTTDNYDNLDEITYYIMSNNKILEKIRRIVIYTENKEININGNANHDYPKIILNDKDDISIYYHDEYVEPGYSVNDDVDNNLSENVKVSGSVNKDKTGDYVLQYFVMNSRGNYHEVTRTVHVLPRVVNYTYHLDLDTKEIAEKVNIIITISGDGYAETILPNNKVSNEKKITYPVSENNTYKFIFKDVNGDTKEGVIKVENVGIPYKETVFTDNYPEATTRMAKVTRDMLINYLDKSSASKKSDSSYVINIEGQTYSYNPTSNRVFYNNDYVICEYYKTAATNLGSINNTVTLLGGSGERAYGPIAKSQVPSDSPLNDNSLLITVRKNEDYNLVHHPSMVNACTNVGEFLAGKKTVNSIIGFSEGAQAASTAVSKNLASYDIYVLINGSAYFTTSNSSLINNYAPFKNTEIIMLECKDNTKWDRTIKLTINDFMKVGLGSNIKLFTNDNGLISSFSNKIAVTVVNHDWSTHSAGWKMIRESNILSYLSSKERR